jgi:hypothetical protein
MRYNRFAGAVSHGYARKQDIQEKYDSGQVEQHEKELSELNTQVGEYFNEFIELFEKEKETLKSFLETAVPEKEEKEKSEKEETLTPDEEYRIFLSGVFSQPPEFKNLTHKDTDSQAVKDKKDQVRKVLSDPFNYDHFRMMQNAMTEESQFKEYYLTSKYRNASLRKRSALTQADEIEILKAALDSRRALRTKDEDSKDIIDVKEFIRSILNEEGNEEVLKYYKESGNDEGLINEYFGKKKEKLGDLSKIEEENKKIDEEIEKETIHETLDNTNLSDEEKQIIKQDVNIEMKTEKHLEKIEQVEEASKISDTPKEIVEENLSNPPSGPLSEEEKLNRLLVKKVGKEKLPLNYLSLTETEKKQLLGDGQNTSKHFINIVKDLTKNKYDLPYMEDDKEIHKKVSFGQVCFETILGEGVTEEAAKKIVANKTDLNKVNIYNWLDMDYCILQYKLSSGSDLTEYEQILKDIFIDQGVKLYIKPEKEKKEALIQETEKFTARIKEIKTTFLSGNMYKTTRLSKSNDPEITKERTTALDKKEKGETLNLLDQFYIDRIQVEDNLEAAYKLRVNKNWIQTVQAKLNKGIRITDKATLDSIKENIDDNNSLTLEDKEAIKTKLDSGEVLTTSEVSYIDPASLKLERQPLTQKDLANLKVPLVEGNRPPLTQKDIEVLKVKVDNKTDKEKIVKLRTNPEAILATNKKELSEAKKKQTQNRALSDFEKELVHQDKVSKDKAKANAPLTKLSIFISKCKSDPKLFSFFQKVLCEKGVKDFNAYFNKVMHEMYSMVVNEKDEKIITRNQDRIKFLFTEATKECNMRDVRENLYEKLTTFKTEEGGTLLDYLPNNMIVQVDETGTVSKLFSMYDNKLSDLKDKIDIQEELMDKFELVKKKIYLDLKEEPTGNPETDSESFIIVKRKLLALIAAVALETGLRPAPVKDLAHPETGEEFGDEAGGMSYKKKLKKDLSPEGKKQYEKNLIETYGIATLKPEHIKFFDKALSANLKFYGKRGVENASKLTKPELVKELEKLVNVASGNVGGPKSLFVLPNGKLVTNTDIVVYFESLAHKAGLKRLKITDFRKLKAVSTIHQSLVSQQRYMYKQIAKLRSVETELAKVEIAKIVMKTVDVAYKEAQKALSHSSVNETINSYINPKLLLNFLSSGGVESAIEKSLIGKTTLKFDPEVFMVQALAHEGIDITQEKNVKFSFGEKDTAILEKAEDSLLDKVVEMGKEVIGYIKSKVTGN